jgi:hypothetical protein
MLKQVQHDGGAGRSLGLSRQGLLLFVLPALPAVGSAAEPAIPPVNYPELPAASATAPGFVPKGWRIEASARGDLDGDGKPDLAMVLRSTDPANLLRDTFCAGEFDTNPRILAILLARTDGGYRLAAENHELIPRRDNPCQVDPFSEPGQIAIERGTLRIDLERMMSAGGWDAGTSTYKLRWRDGALRLIGFDYSNVQRNSGALSLLSINYLNGRVKITTGNVGTDRDKVRWTTLRNRRAPTLDGIGDGLMFDPENLVSNLP